MLRISYAMLRILHVSLRPPKPDYSVPLISKEHHERKDGVGEKEGCGEHSSKQVGKFVIQQHGEPYLAEATQFRGIRVDTVTQVLEVGIH